MANFNLVSRVLQSITSTSLESIRKFYSEMFPGYTLGGVCVIENNYIITVNNIGSILLNFTSIKRFLNEPNRSNTVGLLIDFMVKKREQRNDDPNGLKPEIRFKYLPKKHYVIPKKKSSKVRSKTWLLPGLDLATSNKRLPKPSGSKRGRSKIRSSWLLQNIQFDLATSNKRLLKPSDYKPASSKVRSNSWLLPALDLATSNQRLLKPSVSKPASSKLQRSRKRKK